MLGTSSSIANEKEVTDTRSFIPKQVASGVLSTIWHLSKKQVEGSNAQKHNEHWSQHP